MIPHVTILQRLGLAAQAVAMGIALALVGPVAACMAPAASLGPTLLSAAEARATFRSVFRKRT